MKKRTTWLALLLGFSGTVSAETSVTPIRSPINTNVLTLSVGPAWTKSGETQTIALTPAVENSYVAIKRYRQLTSGELFFGVQRQLKPWLLGQAGLAFAASSNARLQGQEWEQANPAFYDFDYTYQVKHAHVAAKGKLIASARWAQPYLSASIGVGRNRSHFFTLTPVNEEAVAGVSFQPNTTTGFVYTVGAGLQKTLLAHWQAGIGYEFADWGKSSLARVPWQTLNNGLQLNHLYTQQVQVSLTYLS